jgi:hypothetical protein
MATNDSAAADVDATTAGSKSSGGGALYLNVLTLLRTSLP